MNDYSIAISFLGLSVSTITLIYSFYRGKSLKDKMNREEFDELKKEVIILSTKIEIFWRGVAFDAARELHQPHPEFKRRDELLEKYMDEIITLEELNELFNILKHVVEYGPQEERQPASILLNVLRAKYQLI